MASSPPPSSNPNILHVDENCEDDNSNPSTVPDLETTQSSNRFPPETEADENGVFWDKRAVDSRDEHGIIVSIMQHVCVKRCPACDTVVLFGQGQTLNAFTKHHQSANCISISKANRAKASREALPLSSNLPRLLKHLTNIRFI